MTQLIHYTTMVTRVWRDSDGGELAVQHEERMEVGGHELG